MGRPRQLGLIAAKITFPFPYPYPFPKGPHGARFEYERVDIIKGRSSSWQLSPCFREGRNSANRARDRDRERSPTINTCTAKGSPWWRCRSASRALYLAPLD